MEILQKDIAALPEGLRSVVERRLEDVDDADIAEQLGISKNAVRIRHSRAITMMREEK